MASNAARIAIKRREADNVLYHAQQKLDEDFNITRLANWENKTTAKIEHSRIKQRAQQIEQEELNDLESRRKKVRDLYAGEMQQWQDTILNSQESLEEHKERIRKRAYLLKSQREEERRNFVQSMYDKQWRDACDDARTLDAQAVMDKLMSDRRDLIKYKDGDGKVEEAKEAALQAEVWKKQMAELDAQEKAKEKRRHDRNVANRQTLDEQCQMLGAKKAELKRRNRQEEHEELALWNEQDRKKKGEEQALLEAAYARGQATKTFNEQNTGKFASHKAIERQQDLMLLQYALEKEQSEIGAEKAKKQGEKEQAQKYRAFLEEQMIKEACDNTGIEEYRRVESEKIWVKRDNDKKAQDDARSHLMKEVKEGRVEQIRLKELKKEDDRKYFLEQMSLDKMEWDRQENALQEKAAGVKAGIQQNMTALKNQIALRKANIAKEEQEKYLLTRQMEHMELSHQNRLKEQAGVVRSYYPKGHTQWFT